MAPVAKTIATTTYDIVEPGQWWAFITIFEHAGPNTLTMQIQSDWGSWAYSWNNHGRPSGKHFILELAKDEEYLVKKLVSGEQEYDHDATMLALKARVTDAVERKDLDPVLAQKFLEYLDEFPPTDEESHVQGDIDAAIEAIDVDDGEREPLDLAVYDEYQYVALKYRLPAHCCQFFEKVFVPHFVPLIKNELGL